MYDHFYSESLVSGDRLLDASLSAAVRTQFIQLCEERAGQSTAQQHLSFIGNQKGLWKKCRSTEICFVCLGRPPRRRLSCGHRFCDTCVVICELVTLSNANWPKKYCPLCHEENYVDIVLRPATAGVRALEVRGPVQSKENMLDFLRQLQYQAGLPLYSLRDQFDLVTGLDAGRNCFFLMVALY